MPLRCGPAPARGAGAASSPRAAAAGLTSGGVADQHGADLADGPSGVQPLGADVHTVLNAVAAEYAERVGQPFQSLFGGRIPAVGQKAPGLEQTTGTDRKSTRLNSSHVAISYAV